MTETVNVVIAGTPTPIVLQDNAIEATLQANSAAASAANAEAFVGPTYSSQALGEAATTTGQYFAVNDSGIVSIYLRTGGGSTLQRTMLTTAVADDLYVPKDNNGNVAIGRPTAANSLVQVETDAGGPFTRAIAVEHYNDQVGGYGVDIHQYSGAQTGLVLHNYSTNVACQIDGTKTAPLLVLNNSFNPTTSPGTVGQGSFIVFSGFNGTQSMSSEKFTLGELSQDLKFIGYDDDFPWTFPSSLEVVGPPGQSRCFKATSLTSGYAGQFIGKANGVAIATDTNNGTTLQVESNATGVDGVAMRIVNAGTRLSFQIVDAAYASKFGITASGICDTSAFYMVNSVKVVGAQGAAVADGIAAAAAPTQAEFNALVTQFNALLARCRAHGLIAT